MVMNQTGVSMASTVVLSLCLAGCRAPASPGAVPIAPTPSAASRNPCLDGPPKMPKGAPPPFAMERERRKLRKQFDQNGDGRLDRKERQAAQQYLANDKTKAARPGFPPGPPPGMRGGPFAGRKAPTAGPRVSFESVQPTATPPYDGPTLRTLFLDFDDTDWETQLSDFYDTDIEVPATLRVDKATLSDVGVRFRGMSSYMMVPAGFKRSLNISVDAVHEKQNWLDVRTLNLLNSHEDPTYLRAVLFLDVARHYLPAPKANHVHVVINGESWGIYVNSEQFNSEFVKSWFGTSTGARFKVPGSPMGRGGLEYLGDDPKAYKSIYSLRSKENEKVWTDLILLCKVLNQTPIEDLQAALEPLLDIDGALKFLALENAFINGDGYWVRASDYNIFQDTQGRFHIIPHDTNETFNSMDHAPGFSGGSAPGIKVDPLVGLDDSAKPLRSKLLKVPALQRRYLQLERNIAESWLNWDVLGPIAETYRSRISDIVKADQRKLDSFADLDKGILDYTEQPGPCGTERKIGLRPFIEQRRAYLLSHPLIKQLPRD